MPDFEPHCRCPGCGECSAHANAPKLKAQLKAAIAQRDAERAKAERLRELLREARDKLEWIGDSQEGYDEMIRMRDESIARIDAALGAQSLCVGCQQPYFCETRGCLDAAFAAKESK